MVLYSGYFNVWLFACVNMKMCECVCMCGSIDVWLRAYVAFLMCVLLCVDLVMSVCVTFVFSGCVSGYIIMRFINVSMCVCFVILMCMYVCAGFENKFYEFVVVCRRYCYCVGVRMWAL